MDMKRKARIAAAITLCMGAVQAQHAEVKCATLVGSQYILGEGEDIDILVLVAESEEITGTCLDGWEFGGSASGQDKWLSFKQGDVNLLLTNDQDYYTAWVYAAEVCKLFALRGIEVPKDVRLSVHNILMDNKTADEEVQF